MALRRYIRYCVIVCWMVCRTGIAFGNDEGAEHSHDSIPDSNRNVFSHWVLQRILKSGDSGDSIQRYRVMDETRRFGTFAGRTVRNISYDCRNIYDTPEKPLERLTNRVHATSRESTIRRDVFIRQGNPLDPDELVKNLQLLRSRSYIAQAWIDLIPDPQDSTVVDLLFTTQDSWAISAGLSTRMTGLSSLEFYDANILGYGNLLSIRPSFNWEYGGFGGILGEYRIPNLQGTFYQADFIAGKNFNNTDFGVEVNKDFILPEDYMLGASYRYQSKPCLLIFADSIFQRTDAHLDLWGGYSYYLRRLRSSLYFTGRYLHERYLTRPDVAPRLNPGFHNADRLLGGIGLYREHFYTTSLVYGYGNKEYLPAGYRAELNMACEQGEFGNAFYMGTYCTIGGFGKRGGYWTGNAAFGTYVNPLNGAWHGSAIDADIRYFTPLMRGGRSMIRQFLRLNFTRGWNRYEGFKEMLTLTNDRGPLGLKYYIAGTNRVDFNSEMVIFSPWHPLGFQVAFFEFWDTSLLGNYTNPFQNNFFSTFGLGIRVKNEHLIFQAIQLRLGFVVGKNGFLKSNYLYMSNQKRFEPYRFRPEKPQILPFE